MKHRSLSPRQVVWLLYSFLILLYLLPPVYCLVILGRLRLLPLVIYFAVGILLLFLFYQRVILPVAQVDQLLSELSEGNTDLDAGKLKPFYGLTDMADHIDLLLKNIRSLENKASDAYAMLQAAEIDTLQSQINPHFLYNTLDCIRGQAMHYGMKDIEVMTRSLSKIFRYSISNHDSLVSFSDELSNIDSYLLIQQMRFNNKFMIEKNIAEETLDCAVPKLILQPLVENAIHHGLETKTGVGHLRIDACLTENRLVIDVHDDGCGIPRKRLEEINESLLHEGMTPVVTGSHTSIGLKNINERIRLLYGPDYGLTLYSAEDVGTHVQLNLPVEKR